MADEGFKRNEAGRKNRNQKYIERGKILHMRANPNWDAELKEANKGKVGAPFKYAESLIVHLAFIRMMTGASYYALEGIVKEALGDLHAPSHSQICARINSIQIADLAGAFSMTSASRFRCAVDASGLEQHNTGSWITRKWKVRRGFIKIHILIDVDTKKILAFKITDETVGDSTVFDELLKAAVKILGPIPEGLLDGEADAKEAVGSVRTFAKDAIKEAIKEASDGGAECGPAPDPAAAGRAAERIAKEAVSDIRHEPSGIIYGDAAYGSRDNIKAVRDAGLASGIALKKSCTAKGKGSGDAWGGAVRDQLGAGERNLADIATPDREANREEWKKMNGYNLRWIVEIVFSAFKRIFGESVRSLTANNIMQEVRLKVAIYNRFIDLEAAQT